MCYIIYDKLRNAAILIRLLQYVSFCAHKLAVFSIAEFCLNFVLCVTAPRIVVKTLLHG